MKLDITHGLDLIRIEGETEFEKDWIKHNFKQYDSYRENIDKEYWEASWAPGGGGEEDETDYSEITLCFSKAKGKLAKVVE